MPKVTGYFADYTVHQNKSSKNVLITQLKTKTCKYMYHFILLIHLEPESYF